MHTHMFASLMVLSSPCKALSWAASRYCAIVFLKRLVFIHTSPCHLLLPIVFTAI